MKIHRKDQKNKQWEEERCNSSVRNKHSGRIKQTRRVISLKKKKKEEQRRKRWEKMIEQNNQNMIKLMGPGKKPQDLKESKTGGLYEPR